MRVLATALLVVGLSSMAPAGAAPAPRKVTLSNLNLGTYWFGAHVTPEDLVGKVVLFELWGS